MWAPRYEVYGIYHVKTCLGQKRFTNCKGRGKGLGWLDFVDGRERLVCSGREVKVREWIWFR